VIRRSAVVLLGAFGLACAPSAADHEILGDRAYAAALYRDALAEYQLGLKAHAGSAALHAKTGAAALHTGDYGLAADEYRALGKADHSRADEAADGLERAARGALDGNDRAALASALAGLREVAPRRPLGRYAKLVALDAATGGDAATALAYLPTAVATAPDASTADSLLFALGMAAVQARRCEIAVPVFEGLLRRKNFPDVLDGAREGVALCALVRGQQALEQGHPAEAEDWFRRAAAPGAAQDVARAAALGLGDVAMARGDVGAAVEQYQQALLGGTPGDTLAQRAQEKLNALGKPDTAPAPPKP